MGGNPTITDRLPDGADRPVTAGRAVNVFGVEINPCPSRDRPVRSRRGPTAQAPTGMAMSLDTCSPALSRTDVSQHDLPPRGLAGFAPRRAAGLCPPVKFSTRLREIPSSEPLLAIAQRRCVPPRSITSAGKAPPLRGANGRRSLQRAAGLLGGDVFEEAALPNAPRGHHVNMPAAAQPVPPSHQPS